jgi:ABC-2 type transport system permease protein
MNALRKYWAIAWISAKSNLAYVSEVGSRLVFLSVILYIFMRLWKVTFSHTGGTIGGFTLRDMLWYLAMTETIFMSIPRISALVDEDVRTGTLAVQLVRPLSYPLYRMAAYLGERIVRFAVTGAAAFTIALVLVGPLDNLPVRLAFALAAVPVAFVLDFLGFFFVGLFAFWLEDTSGLMLIYSRMTMVLGGMLLPLELFPQAIQYVLKALPFGYMVCGPARLFIHSDPSGLLILLANQALWMLVFASAVALLYSKALHCIALNGG